MEQKQKVVVSAGGTKHHLYPDHEQLLAWVKTMHDKVRSVALDDNGKRSLTIPWETLPLPTHILVTVFPGPIGQSKVKHNYSRAKSAYHIWLGDSSMSGTMVGEIAHDWVLCHELAHCYTKTTTVEWHRFRWYAYENRPPELIADKIAGMVTGYSRELFYAELDR